MLCLIDGLSNICSMHLHHHDDFLVQPHPCLQQIKYIHFFSLQLKNKLWDICVSLRCRKSPAAPRSVQLRFQTPAVALTCSKSLNDSFWAAASALVRRASAQSQRGAVSTLQAAVFSWADVCCFIYFFYRHAVHWSGDACLQGSLGNVCLLLDYTGKLKAKTWIMKGATAPYGAQKLTERWKTIWIIYAVAFLQLPVEDLVSNHSSNRIPESRRTSAKEAAKLLRRLAAVKYLTRITEATVALLTSHSSSVSTVCARARSCLQTSVFLPVCCDGAALNVCESPPFGLESGIERTMECTALCVREWPCKRRESRPNK